MSDPAASSRDHPDIGPLAVLRFVSELALLAALGFAGWQFGAGGVTGAGLAVALPLSAAVVWGWFVAPRAAHRLHDPARLAVEIALFGVGIAGLVAAGAWLAGLALAAMFLASAGHGRKGG